MNLSAFDELFLDNLDVDERNDFRRWLEQLEEANADLDSPYGANAATSCGADHWYEYFNDGFTAREAIEEDMSYG